MEITYRQEGDYLIPNLVRKKQPEEPLTMYGRMYERYLEEYGGALYDIYLLDGTLKQRCLDKQEEARKMEEALMDQMAKDEGVTWQLRHEDPLGWAQRMYNIQNRAREIVREEVIYKK